MPRQVVQNSRITTPMMIEASKGNILRLHYESLKAELIHQMPNLAPNTLMVEIRIFGFTEGEEE